jgi:hypothetical protein
MSKTKVTTTRVEPKPTSSLLQGMMVKSGMAASPVPTRREGHAIPLTPLPGYSSENRRYGMDMREAPIPQRRYAADLCTVRLTNDELRITFAQQGFEDGDVDSAIVIRMNADGAINFTNSLLEMGDLGEISSSMKLRNEALSQINSKPTQTATMMANICSVAIAGKETCMDFYHASAFAIRKAETETVMEIEPVVRVDLRSSLFVSFARRAIEIAEQIKNEGGMQ